MKIAIIHSALGRFGGAEIMTCLHGIHLNKLGHEVEIFYGGPILEEWKEKTSKVLPFKKLPFAFDFSLENLLRLIKLPGELNSFDTVLFHHHVDPFVAYFLTNLLDQKMVWYCGEPLRALWKDKITGRKIEKPRGINRDTSYKLYAGPIVGLFLSDFLYSFSINILKKLDISTTKKFDKIITNSNYTKGLVEKVYGLTENVSVVYPGVKQDRFQKEKAKSANAQIKSDFMLAIGPFQSLKNYDNLIKAYSLLPRELRKENKLVIIGEGRLKEKMSNLARELDVKKDIRMPGFVSETELTWYYSNCKFLLHLASTETFGLTPIEAALFEKPSIAAAKGGPKETVQDGETGILVNPKNPKEIMKAMKKLIKDEDFRLKAGSKAEQRSIEKFSIESSTENLAKELENIY